MELFAGLTLIAVLLFIIAPRTYYYHKPAPIRDQIGTNQKVVRKYGEVQREVDTSQCHRELIYYRDILRELVSKQDQTLKDLEIIKNQNSKTGQLLKTANRDLLKINKETETNKLLVQKILDKLEGSFASDFYFMVFLVITILPHHGWCSYLLFYGLLVGYIMFEYAIWKIVPWWANPLGLVFLVKHDVFWYSRRINVLFLAVVYRWRRIYDHKTSGNVNSLKEDKVLDQQSNMN